MHWSDNIEARANQIANDVGFGSKGVVKAVKSYVKYFKGDREAALQAVVDRWGFDKDLVREVIEAAGGFGGPRKRYFVQLLHRVFGGG